MTIREKLTEALLSKGMQPNQAEAVMEKAIPIIEGLSQGNRINWNETAKFYPSFEFNLNDLHFLNLREIALEWIDENVPDAWFRPMFTVESLEDGFVFARNEKDFISRRKNNS